MQSISGKLCTENQNTHFVFNNISLFFLIRKYFPVADNLEKKYFRNRLATDDHNTAQALCMLDK